MRVDHGDARHPTAARRDGLGVPHDRHEVGAALGVAVLSAIVTTAGELTDEAGAVEAASRGYIAAAGLALAFAVIAFWRMPATRIDAGAGGMHMH